MFFLFPYFQVASPVDRSFPGEPNATIPSSPAAAAAAAPPSRVPPAGASRHAASTSWLICFLSRFLDAILGVVCVSAGFWRSATLWFIAGFCLACIMMCCRFCCIVVFWWIVEFLLFTSSNSSLYCSFLVYFSFLAYNSLWRGLLWRSAHLQLHLFSCHVYEAVSGRGVADEEKDWWMEEEEKWRGEGGKKGGQNDGRGRGGKIKGEMEEKRSEMERNLMEYV